jgi:peptidoglycan/xylan/chitin deacetylase (PgdA/CDA1 family)
MLPFLRISSGFLARSLPLLCLLPLLAGAEGNRFNLSEADPKPRFKITDIDWPAKVGEASICLWHDDRVAALSITIDDNCAPDIPWWREKAAAHNFRATWFVITQRISGSNSFNGKWEDFQRLRDEGHGVESHTVEHLHTDRCPADGKPWSIEWEYEGSLRQINEKLTGPRTSALAYPGGANRAQNSREVAARLYRSARGGTGSPNPANRIDYLSASAMGSFNFGEVTEDKKPSPWSNLNNVIDASAYRGLYYRGWAVLVSHLVGDKGRPKIERLFSFIEANRETLWVGLFTDVAKYGQQRDTATLTVTESTAGKIGFSLTDEMDDAYFNHPLTVKVLVPDAWAAVTATQAGKPLSVRRVTHQGGTYALVQAVPDRGPVVCTNAL